MMESWGPGRTGTPPPSLPVPPAGSNNGGAASTASANVQPSTTAPIASPEGVSDVSTNFENSQCYLRCYILRARYSMSDK